MQSTIERLLDTSRFSMPALHGEVWPLVESHARLSTHLPALQERLGPAGYRKLACAILRHVFLIELVKAPKIETTKFRVRWFPELQDDPRGASFDECVEIACELLAQLAGGWVDADDHLEALKLFFSNGLLPYEAPIDYHSVPARGDLTARMHQPGNLVWKCDPTTLRTLRLRNFLTAQETSPDERFFTTLLDDKVKVKTYLTDRASHGPIQDEQREAVGDPSAISAVRHASYLSCHRIQDRHPSVCLQHVPGAGPPDASTTGDSPGPS